MVPSTTDHQPGTDHHADTPPVAPLTGTVDAAVPSGNGLIPGKHVRAGTEYRLHQLMVVIADENSAMRHMLADALRRAGVGRVAEAGDGMAALDLLNRGDVDVAVLELALGKISGIDLIKVVRRSGSSRLNKLPILVLSGQAEPEKVREARDAGANGFLAKPVAPRTLINHLIGVIEHPRPFIDSSGYAGPDRRYHADHDYDGPERRGSPP